MHRQAADVAAGEEQRAHHVRVGRHHQAFARTRGGQHRAVIAASQIVVGKGAREQFGDEMRHRAPASAEGEVDAARAQVQRAGVAGFDGAHAVSWFAGVAVSLTRSGRSRKRP